MVPTVIVLEEVAESTVPNSQEILVEIRNFVRGASFGTSKFSRSELTRSALYLLKSLPSAREAVLEYLRSIFDDALSVHSFNLELETVPESAPINSQTNSPSISTSHSETNDNVIQEVQDILSGFIVSYSEGWSPIISSWSLDLLGQLSSKYAERRGVLHASNLNEVLQLWVNCHPTRVLIELSTQCISTLINSNPDLCIDALLETSVQQSPHFDWVVAHIGSCFPKTIINRVLACGLKDFCEQEEKPDHSSALLPTPDVKVPKMASVVGILGHLAGQHNDDIRHSLMQMFEESFSVNPSEQQLATVPFLLHLASMSTVLRNVITADVIKALTPDVMNKLCVQIPKWHQKKVSKDPSADLMTLVVHLALQSDENGWEILKFLLETSVAEEGEFAQTCGHILDCLLLQIQRLVFTNSVTFQVEIPILSTLDQHIPQLCQQLLSENGMKPYWLCKLLVFLANYRRQSITSDILAYILCEAKSPSQLQVLAHFLMLMEPTSGYELLENTISEIFSKNIGKEGICSEMFLTNVWYLIQWESKGHGGFGKTRLKFTTILNKFHVQMSKQLTHPSANAASCVIDLLAWLPFPETISVATLISLGSATVKYFFLIFSAMNLEERMKKIPICCTFVSKLSHHACAQNLILRSFLEGALLPSNAVHFGSTTPPTKVHANDKKATKTLLLEENNKHSISITLPQSHSTVFHAGIIGEGRRPVLQPHKISREEILVNVQLLLDVIKAACVPCTHSDEKDIKNEPTPTLQGMKTLALLLVELVSSDVMFNGLPWPEEEFIKVTIERDLYIKRMFDENPVLWDLLLLMATYKPALCYCSVLLRALAAVNMTFWSASRGTLASNYPKQLELAARLVNVMAIGQLVPPPISHVAEIFPKISPYEIYVLLQDMWKYMKANVPAPTVFTNIDSQGYPCREFGSPCPREFTNRLHRILQNNIGNLGHLFIRFFSVEETEEMVIE